MVESRCCNKDWREVKWEESEIFVWRRDIKCCVTAVGVDELGSFEGSFKKASLIKLKLTPLSQLVR